VDQIRSSRRWSAPCSIHDCGPRTSGSDPYQADSRGGSRLGKSGTGTGTCPPARNPDISDCGHDRARVARGAPGPRDHRSPQRPPLPCWRRKRAHSAHRQDGASRQDPGPERRAAARVEPPVVADGLQSSTSRAGRESTNVEGMWGVSRVLTAPPPALVLPRRADGGGATVPALWKGGPGIQ